MRDYTQQLTVEQFGAMVPTATRTLGSQRGPYLGYTPTGAPLPVRFDSSQAPREDRASAALLIGTLGSGKTVASEAIEYAAERAGSLVVDFDPKPDHGLHKLAELADRLEVVELSGDPAQQGRLDPLAIGLEDLREELACSYLLEMLPAGPDRGRTLSLSRSRTPSGRAHAASFAQSSCWRLVIAAPPKKQRRHSR